MRRSEDIGSVPVLSHTWRSDKLRELTEPATPARPWQHRWPVAIDRIAQPPNKPDPATAKSSGGRKTKPARHPLRGALQPVGRLYRRAVDARAAACALIVSL